MPDVEGGRDNRDMLMTGVQAALDYGAAVVAGGGSMQDATNAIGFLTLGIKDQMLAFGLTEEQADAYLATLGLTPENVKTTIELAEADTRKRELEGLLEQLGDIEAGAKADIQAAIDQGQFDTAERKMNDLARERGVTLRVSVTGGGSVSIKQSSSKVDFVAAANGYYADRPTFGLWGEAGPEAIIPLSRPGAAAEVLSNPAVRGPVTEALGAGGGQQIVNHIYGAERQYVLDLMRKMDQLRNGG